MIVEKFYQMRRGISKQSIKSREFFENIYKKLGIFRLMNTILDQSLQMSVCFDQRQ